MDKTYTQETQKVIGNDRLLSPHDVSLITGFSYGTALELIKETGFMIQMHRRVFILESKLLTYLERKGTRNDN